MLKKHQTKREREIREQKSLVKGDFFSSIETVTANVSVNVCKSGHKPIALSRDKLVPSKGTTKQTRPVKGRW